jgi:hypothetical protein
MPRGLSPRDQRQAEFVRQLVEEPAAHRGAEVIQDTLQNLKTILEEKWRRAEQQEAAAAPKAAPAGVPHVYLICDRQDEAAVEPLEDFLFEQGLEVSLSGFEHDEAAVTQIHWQTLEDCDGVLIYYGAGGKSWVEIKLRELLKAVGYRNGRPIEVQAVYVAPPPDRRKERFRSHTAEVIRQEGEQFDPALLAGFVERMRKRG